MQNKVFLCILDGFGLGNPNYKYNAVFQAKMPNLRRFLEIYPCASLQTSGESVGLPVGQMGNSEVGHMTIGSGRVLMQDLPLINNSIETGKLWENDEIKRTLTHLKESGGAFHVLGLCSEGGVHSHVSHITSVANFFAKNNIKVFVHVVTDGRDVPPTDFLKNIENFTSSFEANVEIATVCGRFFTMDRDNKLERTEKGIDLILKGIGEKFSSLKESIESSYSKGKTDEFIEPSVIGNYTGAKTKDMLFFANFRADRGRQASEMLLEACLFKKIFTMMPYSQEISKKAPALLVKSEINNTLSEVLSAHSLKQFKIAETEKYAHVTFFFNGGKEQLLAGEERIIIPSPKVKTYDLQPEMSLPLIETKLLEVIPSKKFDLIVCNIANGDMVGHTGNFEAAKQAAERIDEFLEKIEGSCLSSDYTLLITADHGNLEEMLDENGQIHTQHTTSDVPLFIISQTNNLKLKNGSLANIAPTILDILQIKKPNEMTESLLVY